MNFWFFCLLFCRQQVVTNKKKPLYWNLLNLHLTWWWNDSGHPLIIHLIILLVRCYFLQNGNVPRIINIANQIIGLWQSTLVYLSNAFLVLFNQIMGMTFLNLISFWSRQMTNSTNISSFFFFLLVISRKNNVENVWFFLTLNPENVTNPCIPLTFFRLTILAMCSLQSSYQK